MRASSDKHPSPDDAGTDNTGAVTGGAVEEESREALNFEPTPTESFGSNNEGAGECEEERERVSSESTTAESCDSNNGEEYGPGAEDKTNAVSKHEGEKEMVSSEPTSTESSGSTDGGQCKPADETSPRLSTADALSWAWQSPTFDRPPNTVTGIPETNPFLLSPSFPFPPSLPFFVSLSRHISPLLFRYQHASLILL